MKTEDLNKLPPIERLAEYRRQNPIPVLNDKKKKSQSEIAKIISRLNPNSESDRLTAGRLGVILKAVQPKKVDEEYVRRGGFVAGTGFVWDDEFDN
ncbi:MAG: hypothetical protein ACXW0Q_05730 [Methylovulum sp.]